MKNEPNESMYKVDLKRPVLWEGLGVGIFFLAAGTLLMAERMGWISNDISWGFPLILFAFGVVTIARALKKN